MKSAYYNDNDPYCCAWLRNLMVAGLIPTGDVDERSIVDVRPDDLGSYGQCHFFAGIGGFAYAARIAGWPDGEALWTGGFPCQPFSIAGQRNAEADDRHLWPELHRLIAAIRPAVFIGENVAGIINLALDGVLFDLESAGYASRTFVVPACAVNAPHRRDRVWITARHLADANGCGQSEGDGDASEVGHRGSAAASGCLGDVGDAKHSGCQERKPDHGQRKRSGPAMPSDKAGFWDGGEFLPGADGKARRVEPGIRLLASRIPARVAKLRAFGNAIVPQVAAEIIRAMKTL